MSGLNCIIHTSISQNWQAFVSYFSIKKFLPDSNVSIICDINESAIPVNYFCWTKRLKIKHSFRYSFPSNPIINRMDLALNESPTLLISSNVIMINKFETPNRFCLEREIVFINNKSYAENVLNNYVILGELKETDLISCHAMNEIDRSLVSIKKENGSCINTMINCPFSTAVQLNSKITANEQKVLNFWSDLALIYEAYN